MANDNKKEYQAMKDKINLIVEKLQNSSSHLQTAQNELKHYFKIDGVSADNNNINEIKKQNDEISNYLKENILPEINKKIS